MDIFYNGNSEFPEFKVSDSGKKLTELGLVMRTGNKNLSIDGSGRNNRFYSHTLRGLIFDLIEDETDGFDVSLENENLRFVGNKQAFENLGQGLINYFEDNPANQDHLHLDYFEGNRLLKPTNFSIVFMCLENES